MTRLVAAFAATAVSGVLYALAFPPLRLRALAWIALVPFFAALRHAPLGRRLGLGVLWTLVSGWSVGTWMAPAVASYFDQPLLVGVAIFLVVTLGMATPYYAAFALAYGPLARLGAAAPLLAGAAWAAAELARGRLLNGALGYVGNSPWATLGYSQAGLPPVVQIAALAGVYGVSFLVATANAALAELVAAPGDRRARRGALAAGAVVAGAVGCGALAVGSVPSGAASTPVAIVQGNLDPSVRWSAEGPARTLEAYQRLTRELLAADRPAIVFWPEAALTSFVEQEDAHHRALAALAAVHDVELVFGALRAGAPAGGPPYANSVYRIGPDGALGARYDKQWLLPFMEYFPLPFDTARRRFGRVREFTPGAPTPPLPTRAGAAGLLVCNEAFLPHVAAARAAAGAAYLLNPSNDSWVPDAGFAWQQFDIAAMRAVEQRRFLVRVSDSGPSGVVDPWGRVVAHTDALARATLRTTIVPATAPSPYARAGDVFGVACAVAALLGCALARGRAPR
ncbi:MAG: apolipoprotein N-acyltransferase [Deltaproteobacteria bacterium]|nr:apolipoprotein N-acyltransferase [Deltaproteobacteria bacterium]